jgi:hypothetical protein
MRRRRRSALLLWEVRYRYLKGRRQQGTLVRLRSHLSRRSPEATRQLRKPHLRLFLVEDTVENHLERAIEEFVTVIQLA